MGAQFVFLEFEEAQDGAATGGYAAPSTPSSARSSSPSSANSPPRSTSSSPRPSSPAGGPGAVDADMVAGDETRLGHRRSRGRTRRQLQLTVPDQTSCPKTASRWSATTDFPEPYGRPSLTLYSNNIRHMMTALTRTRTAHLPRHGRRRHPGGDGQHQGAVTFRRRRPRSRSPLQGRRRRSRN